MRDDVSFRLLAIVMDEFKPCESTESAKSCVILDKLECCNFKSEPQTSNKYNSVHIRRHVWFALVMSRPWSRAFNFPWLWATLLIGGSQNFNGAYVSCGFKCKQIACLETLSWDVFQSCDSWLCDSNVRPFCLWKTQFKLKKTPFK